MSSDLVLKPTFSAVFNVEGLVFKFNGYQLKLLKMYRGKGPRCTRRQGRFNLFYLQKLYPGDGEVDSPHAAFRWAVSGRVS